MISVSFCRNLQIDFIRTSNSNEYPSQLTSLVHLIPLQYSNNNVGSYSSIQRHDEHFPKRNKRFVHGIIMMSDYSYRFQIRYLLFIITTCTCWCFSLNGFAWRCCLFGFRFLRLDFGTTFFDEFLHICCKDSTIGSCTSNGLMANE